MSSVSLWEQLALVAIPYVVPVVVALLVVVVKHLLERLPSTQREEVARIVQTGVSAVEQAHPELAGPDKKAILESQLGSILRASHLKVSPALVDVFIEASVHAMNSERGDPPAEPASPMGFAPLSQSVTPPPPEEVPAAA